MNQPTVTQERIEEAEDRLSVATAELNALRPMVERAKELAESEGFSLHTRPQLVSIGGGRR